MKANDEFFRLNEWSSGVGLRMPWIEDIVESPFSLVRCSACSGDSVKSEPREAVCQLNRTKGSVWPDLLGSGLVELESFSVDAQRIIKSFSKHASFFPVRFVEPIPIKLRNQPRKTYGWIDWTRLPVFPINLKASGFMRARVCKLCGRVHYSVSLTYDKQNSTHKAIVLPVSDNAYPALFRLQGYGSSLFCSGQLKSAIVAAGLTNFAFRPLAFGNDVFYDGGST